MKKIKAFALRNPQSGELWADALPLAIFEGILEASAWIREQGIKSEEVEFVEVEYEIKRVIPDKELNGWAEAESAKVLNQNH